jgi:hypothetical protein
MNTLKSRVLGKFPRFSMGSGGMGRSVKLLACVECDAPGMTAQMPGNAVSTNEKISPASRGGSEDDPYKETYRRSSRA